MPDWRCPYSTSAVAETTMAHTLFARMLFGILSVEGAIEASAAANTFDYVAQTHAITDAGVIVVDTRQTAVCQQRSIAGAHCLAPDNLLGPHGRLPSFRQINWVLGTAGLPGTGTVVVVGDNPMRREFVAGMLFLSGQPNVRILTQPMAALLKTGTIRTDPGRPRAMLSQPLFKAHARANLVAFRHELQHDLEGKHPPILLDGRSDAQYWGVEIRAARGGHIPSAQLFAMRTARAQLRTVTGAAQPGTIVYAQDPFSGIAYFTLLRAGLRMPVRVYPGGWRQWAAHTNLPADAQTYPQFPPATRVTPTTPRSVLEPALWGALASLLAVLLILGMLFTLKATKRG